MMSIRDTRLPRLSPTVVVALQPRGCLASRNIAAIGLDLETHFRLLAWRRADV